MAFIDDVMAGNMGLSDTEEYMRDIEDSMKAGWAHLAISLGSIKMHKLYLDVATSWESYIDQQRTSLSQSQARQMAEIGENYLKYRIPMRENGISLNGNREKVRIIKPQLVERDPMYWRRFKDMKYREFKAYQERQVRAYTDVYVAAVEEAPVSVKGTSLYIDGKKVKGINIKEARRKAAEGKRAYVVWIDDSEAEYKKAKRAIAKSSIKEDS